MSWREKLVIYVGTSYFHGIALRDWLTLLRENRFAIAPSCLMRAFSVTVFSLPNGLLRWRENSRFRRQWEQLEVPPPLFVLGHYRGGTTHLFNLLACDPRFAFLNVYQATYPDTFLTTERLGTRALGFFVPRRRPFDNVRIAFDVPQEDEIAMTNATRISPYMSIIFPRRAAHYDRFLTFQKATADEVARWRAGLMRLFKKLTLKYSKPLLLKSPPHTCRIQLLLEMFPQAKFVHIHRNPNEVIQSTLHMIDAGLEWIRLQDADGVDWTQRALDQWREMYDAYFDQRALIPAGNLHEIAFADLERDPLGELRRLYESLGLPPFADVEPIMKEYLASIADYQKNKFAELPADLRARVAETCRQGFDEWGYTT